MGTGSSAGFVNAVISLREARTAWRNGRSDIERLAESSSPHDSSEFRQSKKGKAPGRSREERAADMTEHRDN
jgi:hypothetical protein